VLKFVGFTCAHVFWNMQPTVCASGNAVSLVPQHPAAALPDTSTAKLACNVMLHPWFPIKATAFDTCNRS
jgi:hypothetical protein